MTDDQKKESNSDSIKDDDAKNNAENNVEEKINSVDELKLSNGGDNTDNHKDVVDVDDKLKETCNSNQLIKEESDDNKINQNDDDNLSIKNEENENEQPKIKEEVENDPNFAVICSFLEKFGQNLEIQYSIKNLKTMFEDNNKDLVDLHIKLLRKRRKYINKEKWENALARFCTEYSLEDSVELEQNGYQKANLSLRLRIFVRLLEAMFDYNQKFKSELNVSCEASNLRISAIGRDISGYTYWFQIDPDLNFRLYKDETEEDCSWCLVSKNLDELNDCIQSLEKQTEESFKCSVFVKGENGIKKSDGAVKSEIDENKRSSSNDSKQIKTEITDDEGDEENNLKELKTENDQLIKTEDIVDEKTETILRSEINSSEFKANDTENVQLDKEINGICEYLIDETISTIKPTSTTRPKGRRGKKGRSRGRKNTKNRSNKSKETPKEDNENDDDDEDDGEEMNDKESKVEEESKKVEEEEEDNEENTKTETKSKSSKGRKRRSEIEKLKEDFAESLTTKRFSRRIQALQEKKLIELQEEQKKLEKEMLDKRRKKEAALAARQAAIMAASLACDKSNDSSDYKKSKRRKKKTMDEDDDYQKDSDSDSDEQNEKKKKKRKRKGKKGRNPWEESEDSEEENRKNVFEEEEDYYDDMLDDDNEVLKFDDNEDEFACEEIDPNYEPVVIRRARTVKKSKDDLLDNDIEQPLINDDKPCMKCGHYDNPHWILLCDKCDEGYHTSCLHPQLFLIPSGEWFCPPCEHKILIEKLKIEYQHLSEEIERLLLEKQKQKKRWRFAHCEISSENIINNENGENLDVDLDVENPDKEALNSEEKDGIKVVKTKKYREKNKRKRRPNGYARDEINDLLNDDDDYVENYESSASNDDDDDDDEIDSGHHKSRRSYSDSDETSGSYDDDLDNYIYSDDERRSRHRKERKEKHIDINDYSRSGLKLRSARKRKPISYRFKEYDDLIKSAILQEEGEDEMHIEAGLPRSKGKDISNILIANAEMPDFSINPYDTCNEEKTDGVDTNFESVTNETNVKMEIVNPQNETKNECPIEADDDDEQPIRKNVNQRKYQKKKGLTNLDFSDDDEEEDHASDEDFKMGDDEEEMDEELTEIEDDNADETEVTESDSDYRATSRRRSSRIQRKYSFKKSRRNKKKNKKKSKRKFFVDSDEETEDDDDDDDDDEDEDELSDDLVQYSDESSDYAPRARRAASKKRFSYREDSSTEDEKYQEDDDEYYDEEEVEKPKKKEKEQSTEKRDLITYSKECKKRVLDNDDKIIEDTKKTKLDSTVTNDNVSETKKPDESTKVEHTGENKITDSTRILQPTVLPGQDNLKNIQQQSQTQSSVSTLSLSTTTSTVAIKSSAIKTDNSNYPTYTKSSDAYSKQSTDPLDSIKQLNSKFEYNSNTSSSTNSSVTQIPPVSTQPVPVSTPAAPTNPQYPSVPPGLHYQRHPYPVHPASSNPVPPSQPSYTPAYPPRAPNANYLPMPPPPPPPQQYLAQPNRPQSFQSSQNSMAPGQFHPPPPPQPEPGMLSNIPGPPPYDANANILYSPPSPHYVPSPPAACYIPSPPPNQINVSSASRPNMINEKCDDSYTLTNLDSFKTTSTTYPTPPTYGSNYTNPPTAPPPSSTQLLNLDSRNTAFTNYSTTPPPNKPHYYPRPTYDNMIRSPPVSNYYPPHQPPNVGAGFYHGAPPPPGMHPQPQFMTGPPPPQSPHTNTNSYQRPLAPSPQGPNPPPNYIPRPTTSPRQPNSSPTATPSSSPTFRPPIFSPTPSPYSSPNPTYYSYPGFSPSNGGFSIQNLLLNRPPALTPTNTETANANSVMAVKSTTKNQKSKTKKPKDNAKNKDLTNIGATVVDPVIQSVNPGGPLVEPGKAKVRQKKPKTPKIANLVKDTGAAAADGSSNVGDEKATKI